VGFSWSTFLIEILNFVVLVWILTRFLYQPVVRAIADRQEAIRRELQRAEELKKQSNALAEQYENRLADWEAEKARLRAVFEKQLDDERVRREAELRTSLQRQREQAEAVARTREQETARRLQQQAARDAARFCARLLSRIASPDLEKQLVEVSIADIHALSDDQRASLSRSFDERSEAVVTTRYPLDSTHRTALTGALTQCLGRAPNARFEQSDTLLAGLRIDLGTITLEGNLAGELQWFAEVAAL